MKELQIINPIISFLVVLIFIFILHELIHGLFFKLLCTQAKIKVRYSKGIIYTESINSFYTITKFVICCIAPFIIINFILITLHFIGLLDSDIFIGIATIHGTASIGDLFWLYILLKKYNRKEYIVIPNSKGIEIISS